MIQVEVIPSSSGTPDIQLRLSPEVAGVLKRIVEEKAAELQSPESLARYSLEFVNQVLALAAAMHVMAEALEAKPPDEAEYPTGHE